MKHKKLIPFMMLLSSLGLSFHALGQMPEVQTSGDITYISGGVGQGEATEMKAMAKDYSLEVVCVEKTNLGEGYIAEVNLKILDKKGNIVLETSTNGPIFLANLPSGSYQVVAEYNHLTKKNWAHVKLGKHRRIVFLWPKQE